MTSPRSPGDSPGPAAEALASQGPENTDKAESQSTGQQDGDRYILGCIPPDNGEGHRDKPAPWRRPLPRQTEAIKSRAVMDWEQSLKMKTYKTSLLLLLLRNRIPDTRT